MSYDLELYAPGERTLPVSWTEVVAELQRHHGHVVPDHDETRAVVRRGEREWARIWYIEADELDAPLPPDDPDWRATTSRIVVDLPAWADACAVKFAFDVAMDLAEFTELSVVDPQIGLEPVRRGDLASIEGGVQAVRRGRG